jgi:exopolysaccharide biosynthesis protein
MILFVCEGREMTAGVKGLTTGDVADVLLELGCVEAINLDGGGSSCMLVNGKETIKVSDGSQRSVASTVMLK